MEEKFLAVLETLEANQGGNRRQCTLTDICTKYYCFLSWLLHSSRFRDWSICLDFYSVRCKFCELCQILTFCICNVPHSQAVNAALQKEIQLLVHLRHPNILSIIGMSFPPKGHDPILVMELMGQGSLQRLIYDPSVELDGSLIFSIMKVGIQELLKNLPTVFLLAVV